MFISSLFYSFTFFQRHIHFMICTPRKVLNNYLLFGVGNGSLENQCPGLTCKSSRLGMVVDSNVSKHLSIAKVQALVQYGSSLAETVEISLNKLSGKEKFSVNRSFRSI